MPHPCPHHCPKEGPGAGVLVLVVLAVIVVSAAASAARAAWQAIEGVLVIAGISVGALAGLALVGYAAVLLRRERARPQLGLRQESRAALPAPARRLPTPTRAAIENRPAVHNHLHLHGLSDDQVAHIIRQQHDAAWPAIEEDK